MDAVNNDIARTAIDRIHEQTGLTLDLRSAQGSDTDALVYIGEADATLVAWVKKWAANAPVGVLLNRMAALAEPGKGVLLADYVNPEMAEKLKAAGIQFLDTAGNAFLRQPPVYAYIVGRKPERTPTNRSTRVGRAFQPTGLKVIYAFLTDSKLINATYRTIAEHTGVALGTIGWVIRGLLEQGYLIERGQKRQRELVRYDALLDKWTEAYPQKLREKQRLGCFGCDREMWWKQVNPVDYEAVWGGEIAAARYTQYLNPVHGTLYIPEAGMKRFLTDARLRKAKQFEWSRATVELLEPFWKQQDDQNGLAHPVLVYADLIASGDSRNIETAQRLRDQYLGK